MEKEKIISASQSNQNNSLLMEYDEYRDELISLYKKTTIDNSVISTYIVDGYLCNHSLEIIDKEKNKRIIKQRIFNYHDTFIDRFVIPMIEDYKKENFIDDCNVEVIADNYANFSITTKLNDKLVVQGISIELANKLKKKAMSANKVPKEEYLNQRGIGNFLAIGILLVLIAIVLIAVAYFMSK